ncbi:hypothetical protein [Streptomyces sp. NPDC088789]|uniref:hypothetical protein n=1 Tax=Streptomyces sp. NPDC088789 TaxID=3365899 RepID=UPI0038157209
MTDEHSPTGRLTDSQKARIDYARRDLDQARFEELAQLEPAGLVLLIERLRGRLDDMLTLLDEIAADQAPEGR